MDQKAVEDLVAGNRIRKVAPSLPRAEKLIEKARRDLTAAPKIVDASEEIAYGVAYEAMFKATLALLALHGYRLGAAEQRKAAVEFARAALPGPIDPVLSAYDKMRQRRNDLAYEVGLPVSRTDALEAMKQAAFLVEAIGQEVDPAVARGKRRKKP